MWFERILWPRAGRVEVQIVAWSQTTQPQGGGKEGTDGGAIPPTPGRRQAHAPTNRERPPPWGGLVLARGWSLTLCENYTRNVVPTRKRWIVGVREETRKIVVNIVMLRNFDPYLLVIANRIICNSENITLASEPDRIKIVRENNLVFEMERSDIRIKFAL